MHSIFKKKSYDFLCFHQTTSNGGAGIEPLGSAEPNKIYQAFVKLVYDIAN